MELKRNAERTPSLDETRALQELRALQGRTAAECRLTAEDPRALQDVPRPNGLRSAASAASPLERFVRLGGPPTGLNGEIDGDAEHGPWSATSQAGYGENAPAVAM